MGVLLDAAEAHGSHDGEGSVVTKPTPAQRALVLGIAITIVVAIVVYFVTDEHLLLEIIVVMLGIAIAMQIETLARIERRVERHDRHSRLMAAAESVPWLPHVLEDIAEAARRVVSHPELRPLTEVAQKELEGARDKLEGLRHGQFRADAADPTILFEETDRAQERMRATFLQRYDLHWWSEPVGRQYWSANVRALERGVEISRVFIYDEWSPELEKIVQEQSAAGVEVMVVPREGIPRDCRVAMVVWDDRLTYQGELNSDGETINVLYSVSKADVEAKLGQFQRIVRLAQPAHEALTASAG